MRFYKSLIILWIVIASATRAQTIPDNNNLSSTLKSEIASRNSDVDRLSHSSTSWTRWYLRLVFLAVMITVATFVAQFFATKRANELAQAESDLGSAKDRLVAQELKEKDVEINEAKLAASVAEQRAGDANNSAAKANERAANLESATEKLREANIDADRNLEEEKKKRLLLAVSLLPRNFRDQSGAIAILRTHRGITAIFEYANQDESLSLAKQIHFVLTQSSWPVANRGINALFDGVTVHAGVGDFSSLPSNSEEITKFARDEQETKAAAQALADTLVASGIEARIGFPERDRRTVIIRVGRKPTPLLNEALKELGEVPPTPVNGFTMSGNESWFPSAPSKTAQ